MTMKIKAGLCLALLVATGCAKADRPNDGGGIEVTQAWSRETPPNAPVAAGFVTIRNAGKTEDRLVSVKSQAAGRVEIHDVRDEQGVARMREMSNGVPLPAGATVELKPGGYHLMFISPAQRFQAGDAIAATLVFEKAGEMPVEFEVRGVGARKQDEGHAHHH